MAQVCHLTPDQQGHLSYMEYVAILGYCDEWMKTKEKHPEW